MVMFENCLRVDSVEILVERFHLVWKVDLVVK